MEAKLVSRYVYIVIFFCFFLLGCEKKDDSDKSVIAPTSDEVNGIDRLMLTSFLKRGYTLEKRPEHDPNCTDGVFALPYETDVKCYILKDDKIQKQINSLNDLKDFVLIDTAEKAIEFVRLRTGSDTYFLFRPRIMVEVFRRESEILEKGVDFGACSPRLFNREKLNNLEITAKDGFFEIRRYVVSYLWPSHRDYPQVPALYQTVEKVFRNGSYIYEERKILEGFEYNDIPYPLEPK